MTLPLRLMTLHFSQMGFTDGLTFITEPPSFASPGYSSAGQVIRRHLDGYPVSRKDADKIHPELSGNMRQNRMAFADVNLKHRIGQRFDHRALKFNNVVF
jgi:hypothetical protein